MSERPETITISIETDVTLSVDEVWPDGDAPEVITAQVVADLMQSQGSQRRVLDDWNLNDHDVRVTVERPNPEYRQAEVLFGEPPPRLLMSQAHPWHPFRERLDVKEV